MKRLGSFSLSGGVGQSLLLFLAAASGVLFLPLSTDAYGLPRLMLFFWIGLAFTLLWVVQTITSKRVALSLTSISLWSVALALTALLSAVLAPNPFQQVVGRVMALGAMSMILLFGINKVSQLKWSSVLSVLLTVSLPLNIVFWWQVSPWFKLSWLLNQAFNLQLPDSILFSLLESPLAVSAFLILVTVSGFTAWMQSKDRLTGSGRLFLGTILFNLATLAGIAFFFWTEPSLRPAMLPYQYAWGIAVENFKNFRSLLIGVGPEQFQAAFSKSRDVTFNNTDLWAIRFSTSSSELLHSLTTMGLLNLLSWAGLFLAALRTLPWLSLRKDGALVSAFFVQFAFFVLLPFNITSFILLTLTLVCLINRVREEHEEIVREVVIMLSAIQMVKSGEVKPNQTHVGFALIVSLFFLSLVGAAFYGSGRVYAAHVVYFQSLLSTQKDEVQKTYELQQKAIALYPYSPVFRRTYALTNMAIADSLSQNNNLTEQQKQLLANLLQQAIREGRLAAQINETETTSWENLASIYTRVLNIDGAANWAVVAMVQAIQTDPISPQLRIQMGNVYLQLNEVDQALRLYEQAIQLKPDWYTAFFRYGEALRQKGDFSLAIQAYERALTLVPAGSEDAAIIERALSESRQNAKPTQATGPNPTPAPNPALPPNNAAPTVPETPQTDGNSFDQLLNEQNQTPQPKPSQEPAATNSGNIVLPNL